MREKPIWIRIVACVFVVISLMALASSIVDISETLANPELRLSLCPRNMEPSDVPITRYYFRFLFVAALYRAALSLVFLVGGVLLFRYSEHGRRLTVWGFKANVIAFAVLTPVFLHHLLLSIKRPWKYEPVLGWLGLLACVFAIAVCVAFVVLFQSENARRACATEASAQHLDESQ